MTVLQKDYEIEFIDVYINKEMRFIMSFIAQRRKGAKDVPSASLRLCAR